MDADIIQFIQISHTISKLCSSVEKNYYYKVLLLFSGSSPFDPKKSLVYNI